MAAKDHARSLLANTDLTILLLVRNEAENLPLLVPALRGVTQSLGIRTEILVVDASHDDSARVAANLGCKVVTQQGSGYGDALKAGLSAARGRYIVTLDADLSHPPLFLRHMWAARARADLVIGSRYVPGGHATMPIVRRVLSRLLNVVFAHVLAMPLSDLSSGFRLYRRSVLESLGELTGTNFDVLQEILVRVWLAGYVVREVPIDYRPRNAGRSNAHAVRFAASYLRTLGRLWGLRNSAAACDYDSRAFSSLVLPQRWWQRQRFSLVSALLGNEGRCLDIGCGASQIIRSRPAMVGMDINPGKLRFLRPTNPFLVRGTAFLLPFADRTFDTVLCSEVIEHIPKSAAILSEMNRVLRLGGRLILGTPDYATRQWRFIEYWYQRILPHAYADEHISHYTRDELEVLLKEAGFVVEDAHWIARAELILTARKTSRPARAAQDVPAGSLTA